MDERRTRRTNWTKIRIVRFAASSTTGRREIFHRSTTCSLWRPGRGRGGKNLRWSSVLSLSLSPSKRSSKGGDDLFGKEAREEDARMLSFTRRLVLFLQYTSLPRVGRVLSLEGVRRGTKVEKKKRNKECIYIYVCVMSRQIFQSWLKLCFRDQVTFHSTDDSL